ncbi:MAG: hypothetical protein JWM31_144, partial [Solirubrobacterales bacterium]|nr:hypothetical protein [Solirubrobacterales bacterium]
AADKLQHRLLQVIVGRTSAALPLVGIPLTAAQALLHVGSGADLPKPTSRILSGRVVVTADVDGPFGADVETAAGVALGGSQNVKDGGGTIYLAVDGKAGAQLLAGMAGLTAGLEVRLALTLDRHGRPTELAVSGTGRLDATNRTSSDRGGDGLALRRVRSRDLSAQLTATLDLTDPAHAATASRLVRALVPGHAADLAGAALALGRTFAADARIDVATYAGRERVYGGELSAGLGPGAGGDLELTRSSGTLVDARTRPPGGAWERRQDCLDRV